MENTPNLSLPYLMPSQAQKHVTHNEALQMLDSLVQLSAISKHQGTPPATPEEGDRYIVSDTATGAWTGWESSIACYSDGGWIRFAPREGWRCWVQDDKQLLAWDGMAWNTIGDIPANMQFEQLGILTTPDSYNRVSVKSDSVLISHDDITPGSGNVQIKVNKAGTSGEASIFFQNNWSARAGLGCFGADLFQVKVTADGSVWRDAISVLPTTGNVGIGTASPSAKLHVNGSLSKTSGSFDIAHPDPELRETHRLRHCFVEAPTRGENIYRFQIEVPESLSLSMPLPAYWRHLNENPQIWVSPVGHFASGFGVVNEARTELQLLCEQAGCYNVLLIGTRRDEDARAYFDELGVEYTRPASNS